MIAQDCLCLEDLLSALKVSEPQEVLSASAVVADRRVTVECDDPALFPEFFVMFGGSAPVQGRLDMPADIHLDVHAQCHSDFGWFRMSGSNGLPVDAQEFDLDVEQEHGLFERFPVAEEGWKCVAFRGDEVPAFAFRGRDCIFALNPRWPRSTISYLFWRLLRIRADAVFFHASALGMFGDGTIFVGPAGAGKSTISLALAARGHNFLSDEIGGYVPASGELIPFRRPVGIKPGPRAGAVERGLAPGVAQSIARNGFARVNVDTLFPVAPPKAVPLRRIVFLRGFAERPALRRIAPGREEIIRLQPAMSSFFDVSHSRRIFELTCLLATSKVYELQPGDPDATAVFLEEAFGSE